METKTKLEEILTAPIHCTVHEPDGDWPEWRFRLPNPLTPTLYFFYNQMFDRVDFETASLCCNADFQTKPGPFEPRFYCLGCGEQAFKPLGGVLEYRGVEEVLEAHLHEHDLNVLELELAVGALTDKAEPLIDALQTIVGRHLTGFVAPVSTEELLAMLVPIAETAEGTLSS